MARGLSSLPSLSTDPCESFRERGEAPGPSPARCLSHLAQTPVNRSGRGEGSTGPSRSVVEGSGLRTGRKRVQIGVTVAIFALNMEFLQCLLPIPGGGELLPRPDPQCQQCCSRVSGSKEDCGSIPGGSGRPPVGISPPGLLTEGPPIHDLWAIEVKNTRKVRPSDLRSPVRSVRNILRRKRSYSIGERSAFAPAEYYVCRWRNSWGASTLTGASPDSVNGDTGFSAPSRSGPGGGSREVRERWKSGLNLIIIFVQAPLAQLVEQLTLNQ